MLALQNSQQFQCFVKRSIAIVMDPVFLIM